MDRLQEINLKHDRLRALLERRGAPALWLRRTRNLAWFTAGADASIPVDSESGMYSVLVTPAKRVVYTSNIEATRLRGEERFQDLGFEYAEFPWHTGGAPSIPDLLTDDGDVETDLQALRWVLTEGEQERFRALGRDCAAALDEAIRAVRPGDTEYEIAARLDAACRRYGGLAVVNLIATDERISHYRHPLATSKRLEKYAMIVVCMRRGGLIVAGTRLAHIGKAPAELHEKNRRIAAVDAAAIAATRPGRTLGEVFGDIQAAYAAQGEDGQWQYHHQGGLVAYLSRERVATPGDSTRIAVGQAFAWNPSIVGCKSEDTLLLTDQGFEIVTQAPASFPSIEVEVGGQVIRRPGILEL